ncbi:MAG TPA: DUF2917 domain-containing protein, partial [Candidatus Eisenbacteria bacterium]|nr:DUF2917 domain-containing protein [Candidatus Eisenbacteria bacterium]
SWVTQENDPEDHVLEGGQRFVVDRAGVVVVQAITDMHIRVARKSRSMFIERRLDREKSTGWQNSLTTTVGVGVLLVVLLWLSCWGG